MCGIFGYVGKEITVASFLEGLQRLEYRGYDSCGITGIKNGDFFIRKRPGKIAQLKEELKKELTHTYPLGILHTRWATHGKPNQVNSHPHHDCKNNIAIVHNGIIENYASLKEGLIREGHHFVSETDTEVIAHLIEKFYVTSLREAVSRAISKLSGSFALGVISKSEPDVLIGVRKGSPLIVGRTTGGYFLASDIPALLPFTRDVVYLRDKEILVATRRSCKAFYFNGKPARLRFEKVTMQAEAVEKKHYEHFMRKEIFEQPEVLRKMLAVHAKRSGITLPDMHLADSYLTRVKNVFITACGTAYHAGYVGKYFLEKYCGLDVQIDTSSEFRYRHLNLRRGGLLLTVSQSGETADTLSAVREAKAKGVKVVSICNVVGSSLAKESDGLMFTHAGPEIGVASTKAYTAQIMALMIFALYWGRLRKTISARALSDMLKELSRIPEYQRAILAKEKEVKEIARDFSKFGCFLFLGRGINFPSALEGALKLKEISYVPAEGYPAGEMKHGPIALIDEYRGVVCIAPRDDLYEKMISNIQEIKARRGKVLAIVNDGDREARCASDACIYIPRLRNQDFSPILVAVVMQLFAYHVAKNLGREIDQPRNLAKSVTVE
ncbi:MAG: glutamine--fructose-6-phosphate transaminase (isomerizing) [Candidatus Omnitrophota bacterium]